MKAKKAESLRQKTGDSNTVRLLTTVPLIDRKWLKGVDAGRIKRYLVVKYPKAVDGYIPVWKQMQDKKVRWWDSAVHEDLKNAISGYKSEWDRLKKDAEKTVKARELFEKAKLTRYFTDDWGEAQTKYISWCKIEGCTVERLTLGKTSGDDR